METLADLLRNEILWRNTDLVANLVSRQPGLFGELFRIFSGNTEPLSRRAAWALDIVSEKNPELIQPYLDEIVDLLPSFRHDGLKRHSLRILSRSPLPSESHLGNLVNLCFNLLLSPGESVSAKVYSMEILYKISQIEPDLKKELADSIEWRMNEETPGFKNRGQKIMKKLYSEIAANQKSL
jgi:hypothetical protein